MKKFFWFTLLILLLLIGGEILKVYFIMPFPGSQQDEAIILSYFIHNNIWFFRILLWILLIYCSVKLIRLKTVAKIVAAIFFLFYVGVLYMFNFKFLAEKMFYQPKTKTLVSLDENKIPIEAVVLGVEINGETKAYPLEIIGYHHQVRDSLGGQPIMVTYCTVCRTGRVYSPKVGEKIEEFRLVGMDRFNAMFEDKSTGSWWRQVNGEAVAGELKGTTLTELHSEQTTLESWVAQHPNTLVLQPDLKFLKEYEDLKGYGRATMKTEDNKLEGIDTASWKKKSLVVGVDINGVARAYDWNQLKKERVINDTLNQTPIVLVLEPDGHTFHAFTTNKGIGGEALHLIYNTNTRAMQDTTTQTVWNLKGKCIEGAMQGKRLQPIQAYQEFWHSWETFHPNTTKY